MGKITFQRGQSFDQRAQILARLQIVGRRENNGIGMESRMLLQEIITRFGEKIFFHTVMDHHAALAADSPESREIVRGRLRDADDAIGAIFDATPMDSIQEIAARRFVLGKYFLDQIVFRHDHRAARATRNEIVNDMQKRNRFGKEMAQIRQLIDERRTAMPPMNNATI